MTGIILALFMNTTYQVKPIIPYTEAQIDKIEVTALLSIANPTDEEIEKAKKEGKKLHRGLDHKGCDITMNYYGNQEYFFYEEICKEKYGLKEVQIRKIVGIDIENLEYYRFSETQF